MSTHYDTIIRDGSVISGDMTVLADVAIVDGRIAAIGHGLSGDREIDAGGCYVIPGGVDPHVHLQLQLGGRVSADSFRTGTLAAACGGTTTVIDFTDPQPEESLIASLKRRQAEADDQVAIDYGLHMTLPTWHAEHVQSLDPFLLAVEAGCATFKMYQAYTGMILDDPALYRSLRRVGQAGGGVVLHSETGPLLEELRRDALRDGHKSPIWHERTRPARLEATAVHRAAEIAHHADCPLYIFHVGCAESVAEILAAKLRGVLVFGETCPQYLLLEAEGHLDGENGFLYVCAPPLRTHDDQHVLWDALADDDLQVVSTDHCPWTWDEKRSAPDFSQIPGGVPSIEARLSLIYHFGVGGGHLSPERWVQVCSTNPARLMGLQDKGLIAPGYDADIVIFDPSIEKTLTAETLHEAADWTPYDGITVTGWPRTVLLRGEVIVDNQKYVGTPGQGRFVARSL